MMHFGTFVWCLAHVTMLQPFTYADPPQVLDSDNRIVATVLGKEVRLNSVTPKSQAKKRSELSPVAFATWLRDYRANLMLYRICGPIMRDFSAREKLKPTDEEITQLISAIAKKHIDPKALSEDELQKLAMRTFWVNATSREWRDAKALYDRHGGRVGISSFGACTAIDGLNVLLKEYVGRGELKFHDAELERAFWDKVQRAPFTDVVLRPESRDRHFALPPWKRFEQQLIVEAHKRQEPPETIK